MQEFHTEDAARRPEQAQQDDHAMTGDAMQFELFGKAQRFKRLYFDETMMLELSSFALEVSLQQDWGWEVTPFIRDLMTKLTTDLFAQNECENEEARARAILSSLNEELNIFIDNDWFVFATLSRDLVYNIAADAKDTALNFQIPSNVQDTCDGIFPSKAGVGRLPSMRAKITMHVLARLCAESEKNVSKKFGGIVSETFVDVETLVFQQKDLWITLWMECMDDSDNAKDILHSVRSKGCQGTQHQDVAGLVPTKNNFKHFGQRYFFIPHVSVRPTF